MNPKFLTPPRVAGASCLALALMGAWLLAGCSQETRPRATTPATGPNEVVEDFHLTETSAGMRSWTMTARRAQVFDAENRVEVESLTVDFFDASGSKYSHLRCDRGTLNQTTNDLVANGNVDIRTSSGAHVQGQTLKYWDSLQRLTSETFIQVTDSSGSVISGTGFDSDLKVEHYRVGQVSARLKGHKLLEKDER